MKILFVSGHVHYPQGLGGVSSTIHELANALERQGHETAVLAQLHPEKLTGLTLRLRLRLTGGTLWADRLAGYPTYRVWNPLERLAEVVERFRPDVAMVQIGQGFQLTTVLRRAGIPVLYFLHNVDLDEHGGDLGALDSGVRFIANSHFTAERYRSVFGISSIVVPPQFAPERYRTTRGGSCVTLINPWPSKGLGTALEIASRCQDIPFEFVESWHLGKRGRAEMERKAKALGNLVFTRKKTDMRAVYARAKFLIAPSVAEEAWGRVATEAQFSGIPTIAMRIGGLPEAVGPGGVLIDRDAPIDAWVAEVRRLWSDPSHYEALSQAAMVHAGRPEIDPEIQLSQVLEMAAEVRAAASAA